MPEKDALAWRTARLCALTDRAWGPLDERTERRTAMVIAAMMLIDAEGTAGLGEWLLTAAPDRARHVATMVAVHALRRGMPQVWDVLAVSSAMDLAEAAKFYNADVDFIWSPEPGDLIEVDGGGSDD
jgi:hypothetical protein